MLNETGYVNGIENYSRILDGRPPGSRPYSLLDFFELPFLTIIDESHATVPQVGGMYNGDKSRKTTLVDYGFRIPSALDNRPLQFNEFEDLLDYIIYSSATPADYELEKSEGIIAEQIIRPTGLVDPEIEVKPAKDQVDDLIDELRSIVEQKERALVTTLTKKMSEDLTEYLETLNFKVRYLHSEIDTLERPKILRDLRKGAFDILVGINLLREGLDLPEVSLVAILDADREGFLRSTRSLIQIAGRAARNIKGKIILYADTVTKSIQKTLDESERRRKKQIEYNTEHDITPESVVREIREPISLYEKDEKYDRLTIAEPKLSYIDEIIKDIFLEDRGDKKGISDQIRMLEKEMVQAAENLEFEKAARLRDKIVSLKSNKK
jgi:excinuclease ABC subunit B